MKFNAIVGNPPYQVMDGGNAASALPVYQYFVETAKLLSPNYTSIIIPAKWYSGGRNLDEFRKNMLNDKRIAILHDVTDSRDLFPSADIAGGLCYFLWNKEYQGNCLVTTHNYGHESTSKRDLSTHESFIRFAESFGIISKVEKFNEPKLSSKVYPQRPFGLRTFVTPLENGDITLRYNKGKGPYRKDLIQQNQHLIDKWKVITSRTSSEHAGQADKEGRKKILSATEVLAPGEICTETYILIDTFETETEATNCLNYLKGNFARILISAKVTAQMVSQDSFSFVPIQDYSEPWTDEKLYAKYGITPDEQAYIESLIKPME